MTYLDRPSTPQQALAHYGVKGMRWGHRKAEDSSGTGKQRLSRKEFKAKVRQEKSDFYQKKADSLLKESLKDPEVLVRLKSTDPYPTILTGKEFVDYLTRGGIMDIKATDIYARKTSKNGPYELNAEGNRVYKKPKR